MMKVRKSLERGDANHGWLKSKHTFSFADYYDPQFMGFGPLRVINEDRIDGGTGFGAHGHRDMEIISYVIEGALAHEDSMGNKVTIKPGEVQRMSAGTGVRHAEQNELKTEQTHFLQIWIVPEKNGIDPGYAQKSFEKEFAKSDLVLVASHSGKDGSITINQDVEMYAAKSPSSGTKVHKTQLNRRLWVQIIGGEVTVEGEKLEAGDGAALEKLENVQLSWAAGSEFILFDMPE